MTTPVIRALEELEQLRAEQAARISYLEKERDELQRSLAGAIDLIARSNGQANILCVTIGGKAKFLAHLAVDSSARWEVVPRA